MKVIVKTAAMAIAAALFCAQSVPGRALEAPRIIPIDRSISVGDIEAACTGVGQTRLDARWSAYPVRIEFSNMKNDYLLDATITVKNAAGAALLTASCDGPWLLLKLPKGRYSVSAVLNDAAVKPRSASFSPPDHGQMRLVLQFPDAPGD